jgi:hypothetical protein
MNRSRAQISQEEAGRNLNEAAETRAAGAPFLREQSFPCYRRGQEQPAIETECSISDTSPLRGLRPVNLPISSLLPGFSGQGGQEMGTNREVALVELTDAEIEAVAGGAKETEASTGIKG